MASLPSFNEITDCRLCPRLVRHREEVALKKVPRFSDWDYWGRPVPSFGDPNSRLLIVGLAPAAHGANRTGRMFTGDRSGDWLYRFLHQYGFANQSSSLHRKDGLKLKDCLITAAAHCVPPGNKPLPEELTKCQPYFLEELRRLKERLLVVVTLGQIGFLTYLRARKELGWENPKPLPTFGHSRQITLPDGVTIISSYHPSQQNTFTGRLTESMFEDVFRKARNIINGM